jgi:ribosomal protein S18 acetylase RimI-like enzyme
LSPLAFRSAISDDAGRIAALHADSWRRHYRGAFADSFLDGDVEADRRAVWSVRLAPTADRSTSATILAEHGERLLGFIHVAFDDDPTWGSLIDNLHVVHDRRRTGIGRQLLVRGATSVAQRAASRGMYLWVLAQNAAAQRFYEAHGGTVTETEPTHAPGGDPSRVNGASRSLRMTWPDASRLVDTVP